ncbi:hypothetical protein CPB83DRAFT_756426, partial [Crepidotus variabilis]
VLKYGKGLCGEISITAGDVDRLSDSKWLNDNLIELVTKIHLRFWANKLGNLNPALRLNIHIFNSFLYTKFSRCIKISSGVL